MMDGRSGFLEAEEESHRQRASASLGSEPNVGIPDIPFRSISRPKSSNQMKMP
jgi:hypothetical protein